MEDNNAIKLMKQMEQVFIASCTETEKFVYNNNKSAATRLRKNMQVIKTLAQEVRKEVQAQKNAVKV